MKNKMTQNINSLAKRIRLFNLVAVVLATSVSFVSLASTGDASTDNEKFSIDSFDHQKNSNLGIPRQFISDQMAGGKTTMEAKVATGVMTIKGKIIPPRGQPGWASTVLLLDPKGLPMDATPYTGVKLRIKLESGSLSLSANSVEIENFDYHAAPISIIADGQFHDINIPFKSMVRSWSEQTPLNKKSINSLSIVSFAMQQANFNFTLDEVGFY